MRTLLISIFLMILGGCVDTSSNKNHSYENALDEDLTFNQASEQVNNFIDAFSTEQRLTLENFFRLLMKNHSLGYVLYGEKPMCIEGWSLEPETLTLSEIQLDSSIYAKWLEIWLELNVSAENKNYILLNFGYQDTYHHFVCINRKAFTRVVNDNITLFRYVLGPTLNAENLLKELIEAKDNFYDVLKNDNVLLGILLGYGCQNALLVSRRESICDSFFYDHQEDFPFIAKKIRFQQNKLPKMHSKRPSLGYDTLENESKTLQKRIVPSKRLKSFSYCKIPYFGCEPDTHETQELIEKFTRDRSIVIKKLESEHFLKETLTRLFTTTSDTIDIPKIPSEHSTHMSKDSKTFIEKLVNFINQEVKSKDFFHASFLDAFFEGMIASQHDGLGSKFYENQGKLGIETYEIEQDLIRAKNLSKSDRYFNVIEFQEDIISLIPKKVYYKIARRGDGPVVSHNVDNVSFHYSYHSLESMDVDEDFGTVKDESVEHLLPGIALALIGMQKGEEREVYVHPEYGYGENTYLPPNITIIAKIQLLNFTETDKKATIFPPNILERKDFDELLKKYEKLNSAELYQNGFLFWESVKKNFKVDDQTFIQIQKMLHSEKGNTHVQLPERTNEKT